MSVKFLAALAIGLAASGAAQAASFDCAKAQSPFEMAICASPEASMRDEVLAQAYATALGGLSEPAAKTMREGQRAWLDFAQRACTEDAQPAKTDYDEDGAACVSGLLYSRIRDLEASRMVDGRRVYLVERFDVLPDPDKESWSKVATKEVTEVRIDGKDAVAAAFNKAMADFGKAYDKVFAEADGTSDADITMAVEGAVASRITVSLNEYWYGHGAAHGNYAVSHLNFLTGPGRMLKPEDIFAGKDWQKHLAEKAFAGLSARYGENLFVKDADELMEAVGDPTHWRIADEGIAIQFQPYEVASYADGAPEAMVAWSDLEGDLVEGYAEAVLY